MSLFDLFTTDNVKSTGNWVALTAKRITRGDWSKARNSISPLLAQMVRTRRETPEGVLTGIFKNEIDSLSSLGAAIVISEAESVNPTDIPLIQFKIASILREKGIPVYLI